MKFAVRYIALVLCVCLLAGMAGCSEETTAATATASTGAATQSTAAVQDIAAVYDPAVRALESASELAYHITYSESRLIGTEIFLREFTSEAVYTGRNTGDMKARITEELAFGSYKTQSVSAYASGNAYCSVNGCDFISPTDAKSFLAAQIPAVLLDRTHYASFSMEQTETGTHIQFLNAAAPEDWAASSADAQFLEGWGTAALDESGNLISSEYHLQYQAGEATYFLEVSVQIKDDLPSEIPLPEDSNRVKIGDIRIPKMILQVVGDIYSARAISSSATERMYCQVASMTRTQQVEVYTHGSGADFAALADHTVTLVDYTNSATVNTQTETFLDGAYSYSTNGSTGTSADISAERMRTYCEDLCLSYLMTTDSLAGAEIQQIGDFYCIRLEGSETFAEGICDKIYRYINMDLDGYAEYSDDEVSGYLTIRRDTGLPTALGICLSRSHTIYGETYQTTYQVDQALTLPGTDAYETITGQAPSGSAPETQATPLLYKVTGQDGQTLWLFGTIHVGDARTGNLPQALYDAFAASDALAVEYDTDAFGQLAATDGDIRAQLTALYYYSDGSSLSGHLDPALYETARWLLLASGANSASAEKMRPFLWENIIGNFYLRQSSDLTAEQGMDQQLLKLARQQEKTVLEVESGLAQVQMLAQCSESLQELLLRDMVNTSLSRYAQEISLLYESWCAGDTQAILTALQRDPAAYTQEELALFEEYDRIMTEDRNRNMLDKALSYLESGETVFMAVGIAHIPGEGGLAQALEALGYTVEPVIYE